MVENEKVRELSSEMSIILYAYLFLLLKFVEGNLWVFVTNILMTVRILEDDPMLS